MSRVQQMVMSGAGVPGWEGALCYHVEAGRTGGLRNSNAEWLRARKAGEAAEARETGKKLLVMLGSFNPGTLSRKH